MKIVNLLPDYYIEHDYFNKMISCFDQKLMEKYTIYISHNYKELPSYGKGVIAILTAGDERGIPPSYSDKVLLVFKHHLDKDSIKNNYHIPLPYCNGFNGDYSIPIEKRKYDVFFVGRKSRREDMISEMNKLRNLRPNLKYQFYVTGHKFKAGWPIEKYAEEMMNSKIVLSPQGAVRAECIRFTEAVKCGCAIISCKHPQVTCFKECPASYLGSWKDIITAVDKILEPSNLNYIHERMKLSWNKHFSPEAVGCYINKIVEKHHVN